MQAHRQIEILSLVRKVGRRKRWRAKEPFGVIGKTVAFCRDSQQVGIELAVHVLIMNDGYRIRSRRDVFKVAPRLLLPDFYDHHVRGRPQKLMREPLRRFKQRARDRAGAVVDV